MEKPSSMILSLCIHLAFCPVVSSHPGPLSSPYKGAHEGNSCQTAATVRPLTPRRLLTGHHGPVTDLTYCRDGNLLASNSDDGTLKIWEVATGRCLQTLPVHGAVLFSPDGKLLLAGPGGE